MESTQVEQTSADLAPETQEGEVQTSNQTDGETRPDIVTAEESTHDVSGDNKERTVHSSIPSLQTMCNEIAANILKNKNAPPVISQVSLPYFDL